MPRKMRRPEREQLAGFQFHLFVSRIEMQFHGCVSSGGISTPATDWAAFLLIEAMLPDASEAIAPLQEAEIVQIISYVPILLHSVSQ